MGQWGARTVTQKVSPLLLFLRGHTCLSYSWCSTVGFSSSRQFCHLSAFNGGTQRVFSFGVFDLTGEWKALREIA